MRPRISIRESVHPSVRPSERSSRTRFFFFKTSDFDVLCGGDDEAREEEKGGWGAGEGVTRRRGDGMTRGKGRIWRLAWSNLFRLDYFFSFIFRKPKGKLCVSVYLCQFKSTIYITLTKSYSAGLELIVSRFELRKVFVIRTDFICEGWTKLSKLSGLGLSSFEERFRFFKKCVTGRWRKCAESHFTETKRKMKISNQKNVSKIDLSKPGFEIFCGLFRE